MAIPLSLKALYGGWAREFRELNTTQNDRQLTSTELARRDELAKMADFGLFEQQLSEGVLTRMAREFSEAQARERQKRSTEGRY